MRRPKFLRLLLLVIPVLIAGNAFAQIGLDAPPEADRLVRIDAVFPGDKIVPGRTTLLGIRFRIAPKWHIYWRNPGESGSEPRITIRLPEGFKAGPVIWLTASAATLASRIGGDETSQQRRPSLTGKSIEEEVADVLESRMELYKDAATMTFDAETESPEQIAERIIAALNDSPVGGTP